MKPYYDDGQITLYCADARDVLPLIDRADLLLTDPPYGLNGGRSDKDNYDATLWADTPEYVARVCVGIVEQSLSLTKRGAVTPGKFAMWDYPKPDDVGCFWSPTTRGRGPWGFNVFNPILFYGICPGNRYGSSPAGVQMQPDIPDKTITHPCPKPLKAWQWLLTKGSIDPNDVIIDPFVGSGTTLRAAKNLGRKAIGIEIEERYCEEAVKRLAQEVLKI